MVKHIYLCLRRKVRQGEAKITTRYKLKNKITERSMNNTFMFNQVTVLPEPKLSKSNFFFLTRDASNQDSESIKLGY